MFHFGYIIPVKKLNNDTRKNMTNMIDIMLRQGSKNNS